MPRHSLSSRDAIHGIARKRRSLYLTIRDEHAMRFNASRERSPLYLTRNAAHNA